jgi:hypothetical protein
METCSASGYLEYIESASCNKLKVAVASYALPTVVALVALGEVG